MKIITWNVNRFDRDHNWYIPHKAPDDLPVPERKECAEKIILKLSELLTSPDDIAILQEVPYHKEWETTWKVLFENFETSLWFDAEPKREDFNYNSTNITIAVTIKDSNWTLRPFDSRKVKFGKEKACWNYVNRYVELENGSISILGLHLNFDPDQWQPILDASNNSEFSFIVGDFNINDLLYPSQDELNKLEKSYNRLIKKDIITQNQTLASLDNIFINKDICANPQISVWDYCYIPEKSEKSNRNIRYSDHNACICEL